MVGAVAVAAAAVAVVLGIGLVRADNKVSNLQAGGAGQTSAVTTALRTPGHQVVNLVSSTHAQMAQFVVVPDGRGWLVSSNLPSLSADKTYQLWAIEGNQPISLGLLGRAPQGAVFTMAGANPSHLSITAEPVGGAVFPTGPIIATGSV